MHARANTRAHTHRHEDLSLNNRGMDDDTQQQQQQHLCRRARSLVPAPRPLPSQTAAASLHVLNAGVRADISHRGLCGCTENVIFPASVEGYSLPGSLGSLVQWTGSGADATATSGGITSPSYLAALGSGLLSYLIRHLSEPCDIPIPFCLDDAALSSEGSGSAFCLSAMIAETIAALLSLFTSCLLPSSSRYIHQLSPYWDRSQRPIPLIDARAPMQREARWAFWGKELSLSQC